MTVALAIVGFTFSVPAIIIGVIVGATIGRVAGHFFKRKLTNKNIRYKHVLRNFFDCYLQILSRYMKKLELDVNSSRIILESVTL